MFVSRLNPISIKIYYQEIKVRLLRYFIFIEKSESKKKNVYPITAFKIYDSKVWKR